MTKDMAKLYEMHTKIIKAASMTRVIGQSITAALLVTRLFSCSKHILSVGGETIDPHYLKGEFS